MLIYEGKFIGEKTTNIVKDMIVKGFNYNNIENIIRKNFEVKDDRQYENIEDIIFHKLEKFSVCIEVEEIKTKEKFYYMTVKELSEDTGLTTNAINSAIHEERKIRKKYNIRKKQFATNEITENKEELFKNKLGKLEIFEKCNKSGKHLDNPLKVTDTKSGIVTVYEKGRNFCNKFKMPTYNLSEYVNGGYRFKGRYKLEKI